MSNYRIKIIKEGLELEVEGDKKFVLDILNRYDKPSEQTKGTGKQTRTKEALTDDIGNTKSLSAGEFIRKTGFKKAVDVVLAFAYYLEKHNGLTSFAPTDINTCYYEAKMESSNTSQYIIYLIRKGYMMPDKKIGKGKKKYTLTTTGIDYIEKRIKENSKDKEE